MRARIERRLVHTLGDLREKIEKSFPTTQIFLHCRKYLEEKVKNHSDGFEIFKVKDVPIEANRVDVEVYFNCYYNMVDRHALEKKINEEEVVVGAPAHQVDAVLQGAQVDRRGKGAVDGQEDSVLPGDLRARGNVGDRQKGIPRALNPQQPCFVGNGSINGGQVIGGHQRHIDSRPADHLLKQAVGSSVDIGPRHDVRLLRIGRRRVARRGQRT